MPFRLLPEESRLFAGCDAALSAVVAYSQRVLMFSVTRAGTTAPQSRRRTSCTPRYGTFTVTSKSI